MSFTLEGCRDPSVDLETTDFVCADGDYTTGNLGKTWNELDLVPHRLTTSVGNQDAATTSYDVAIAADAVDGGVPGYDLLANVTLNTTLSDPSCEISVVNTGGSFPNPTNALASPGIGGTDTTRYFGLHIEQDKGTTCVIDWVERLALGSHAYPGSSLHTNAALFSGSTITTSGIGARDVSIPVKEILPQDLDKTMTALQGEGFGWTISKSSSPASVTFEDTCLPESATESDDIEITVTWTKLGPTPAGTIAVQTNVTATNPAHRSITVNVSDQWYSGTTSLGASYLFGGSFDVPANSSHVFTFNGTVPSTTTDLNDIATATYTDTDTGIAVPGTTTATATATVQTSGAQSNASATITDIESITGTGWSYSIESVDLPGGTFTDSSAAAYTLGTETTDDITWTLEDVTSSGSATFVKHVHIDAPAVSTGTLSDIADATGSDGFDAEDADASVSLSADAVVTLGIQKDISGPLAEDVSFTFDVTGPNGFDEDVVVTVLAGQTTATVDVGTAVGSDLEPGTYFVTEQDPGTGWTYNADPVEVDLNLPSCESTTIVTNSFGPASAAAVKTIDSVDPNATVEGWEMCLLEDGVTEPIECADTDSNGRVDFAFVDFEDGVTYEIVETGMDGWDQTDSTGDCTFTPDFPVDGGRAFVCTFENTQRGTVSVEKTVAGGSPGLFVFTFEIREDASASAVGTIVATDVTDANGDADFAGLLLVPGDYQLCESGYDIGGGWHSSLSDVVGSFVPGSEDASGNPLPGDQYSNDVVCVPFELDPGEHEVFQVDNTPPPGGDARTIGYWKNHTPASCSGGRQVDSLTPALGTGILIGDLLVDTCTEAVRLLNKSTVNTNKKMASDAAYGLAAQLLAARLNTSTYWAAATCTAANNAMAAAQTLLDAINFNGTGDYLGPKVKGAALTQRNTATQLASTLDSYNNNTLCP